ncbi:nuclease-related domain-containing protein [Neobacillus sp. LXY-4]|uniref:nuclease-related domain-containing protein n=1 Tax=Neobacillus sp. LXY-4 TaxID=3379826 RepID=UPI003EE2559B
MPPNHPKIPIIEEDSRKREAGFIGEQKLDRLLTTHPQKDYHMFNGLHLGNNNGSTFQIDSFIYCPRYFLITEVKNMNGELTFDRQAGQLIQRVDNKQIGYEDPLLQAEFQVRQLKIWLIQNGFPVPPIEHLVMMSHQNCVLRFLNTDSHDQYRICRGRQVIFRIEDFDVKYKHDVFTPAMMRKLTKLLLKKHFEPSFDIEKIYRISRSELLNGVHCPICRLLGMIYYQGWWICPTCGCKSKDAWLPALRDYYLLHGPWITNQQFREFLGIESGDVAYQHLKKLNLKTSGNNKQRFYHLTWDLFNQYV